MRIASRRSCSAAARSPRAPARRRPSQLSAARRADSSCRPPRKSRSASSNASSASSHSSRARAAPPARGSAQPRATRLPLSSASSDRARQVLPRPLDLEPRERDRGELAADAPRGPARPARAGDLERCCVKRSSASRSPSHQPIWREQRRARRSAAGDVVLRSSSSACVGELARARDVGVAEQRDLGERRERAALEPRRRRPPRAARATASISSDDRRQVVEAPGRARRLVAAARGSARARPTRRSSLPRRAVRLARERALAGGLERRGGLGARARAAARRRARRAAARPGRGGRRGSRAARRRRARSSQAANLLVEVGARALRSAGVRDVADEHVLEAERRSPEIVERASRSDEVAQRGGRRAPASTSSTSGESCVERAGPEDAADHGGALQEQPSRSRGSRSMRAAISAWSVSGMRSRPSAAVARRACATVSSTKSGLPSVFSSSARALGRRQLVRRRAARRRAPRSRGRERLELDRGARGRGRRPSPGGRRAARAARGRRSAAARRGRARRGARSARAAAPRPSGCPRRRARAAARRRARPPTRARPRRSPAALRSASTRLEHAGGEAEQVGDGVVAAAGAQLLDRLLHRVVVGDAGGDLDHLGERPVRDALAVRQRSGRRGSSRPRRPSTNSRARRLLPTPGSP